MIKTPELQRAREIMQPCIAMINATPAILSLLYELDIMPEQVKAVRSAKLVVAICELAALREAKASL